MRTALQWSWKSPAAVQNRLSHAGAQIHPVNGSGLQYEARRERGPALLLLHAVLESGPLPLADGVSNGLHSINKNLDEILIPYPVAVCNKGDPNCPPNPLSDLSIKEVLVTPPQQKNKSSESNKGYPATYWA